MKVDDSFNIVELSEKLKAVDFMPLSDKAIEGLMILAKEGEVEVIAPSTLLVGNVRFSVLQNEENLRLKTTWNEI